MKVISLEEYKQKVAEFFKQECSAYPMEEVEKQLKEQEKEIEQGYYGELAVMDLIGCPPFPIGRAYGMFLKF